MSTDRIGKWMMGLGLAAGMGLVGQAQAAAPNLMITEIMSKSDVTEDCFEITNFGDAGNRGPGTISFVRLGPE